MGKNKKKSEPTMSKPELSKRLLALMSNHPGESYNYKQLAMRLQVKSMDMKRQISEVLRELGEKGELEEISTGRYKMRQRGAYITGPPPRRRGGRDPGTEERYFCRRSTTVGELRFPDTDR